MASGQIFELAILLSLKDAMSGKLNLAKDNLRAYGKEGHATLQEIEALQKSLQRDLVIGGVGVATLAMLKKGVDNAGDFESAMADLRLSIQEVGKDGKVNIGKMNAEMNQLESLSVRLGNKLPGTTQDFVEMLATLKQGGLSTNTILNGTGEAVANLAVITKQVPKDLAEPFTQYALQFGLTGEEAVKLADTLARLKFATGLNPQDLIEGSKFFQLRVGAPLGFKGLEGADVSGRFLATLKRSGLEGGLGGREAATFLNHMITNKDALKNVKKEFGIDVQLFDKKGQFLGFDNLFKQMEKFRKLSAEKQMGAFKELGGEEGAGVGVAIMKSGLEGWKNINEEIDKSSSAQQKLNEITDTYNAKVEAVQGTLQNLKVTIFTPALDFIKPTLDSANDLVGKMQEWAKEYPTVSKYTVGLLGASAATLTVVSGIKAMTTAWRLWRIVSAIGAGDSLASAATQANNFGGAWGRVNRLPRTVQFTLLLTSIGFTIEQLIEFKKVMEEFNKNQKEENTSGEVAYKAFQRGQQTYKEQGLAFPRERYTEEAKADFQRLQGGNRFLEYALAPNRSSIFERLFGPTNPLTNYRANLSNEEYNRLVRQGFSAQQITEAGAARFIQKRVPSLQDPKVMGEFRKESARWNFSPEATQSLDRVLQQAFPESFKQSSQSFVDALREMLQPTKDISDAFEQTKGSITPLPPALDKATQAAVNFSIKVNSLEFNPPSSAGNSGQPGVSQSASGSIVQRDGLAFVHRGNVITPASLSRRGAGDWLGDFQALRTVASQAAQNGGSFRLRVNKENTYNIVETARAAVRNETKLQPTIKLGDINIQSGSNDVEAIISQVAAEQNKQIEELRRQLNNPRRFDRMGARVIQTGKERA